MKEIAISEFRAKCFAILERVRKTRRPIRVTRYGKPFADISPPSQGVTSSARRLGGMVGTAKIVGDIVGPTGSLDDWEAWRD
jgi:prevent-host-death family protein